MCKITCCHCCRTCTAYCKGSPTVQASQIVQHTHRGIYTHKHVAHTCSYKHIHKCAWSLDSTKSFAQRPSRRNLLVLKDIYHIFRHTLQFFFLNVVLWFYGFFFFMFVLFFFTFGMNEKKTEHLLEWINCIGVVLGCGKGWKWCKQYIIRIWPGISSQWFKYK